MTDLSALPPAVTLPVGGRVLVPLPSYAGSGNAWSAHCLGGPGVADLRVQLGPATDEGYAVQPAGAGDAPASDVQPSGAAPGSGPGSGSGPGPGPGEPPAAAPVPETLVVEGLEAGEARWQLVLARPFAPDVPTATHELRVTVSLPGGGPARGAPASSRAPRGDGSAAS